MQKLYTISWQKKSRHAGRWLYLSNEGVALLIYHKEKATRFNQEEVNAILLAMWSAGRWSEAGQGTFPCVSEA